MRARRGPLARGATRSFALAALLLAVCCALCAAPGSAAKPGGIIGLLEKARAGHTTPTAPSATAAPTRTAAPTTTADPSIGGAAGATGAPTATATTPPTTTYVPPGAAAAPDTATTPAGTSTPTATSTQAGGVTTTPAATAPPGAAGTKPAQQPSGGAKAGKGDRGLSSGAIAIVALAALLVLSCIAWALARRRAFEPHWLLSLRHAMAEAGFRASATWSEFADWMRLGR